jgi:hypothetical protein
MKLLASFDIKLPLNEKCAGPKNSDGKCGKAFLKTP